MRDWWQLLRRNPAFTRLWAAEAISLFGDWFSLVAISILAVQAGGGEGALAVGLTLAAHELPMGLMRPVAGVLADRFDRRNLLVGVHLGQVVLTLAMAERALHGDVFGLQALVVVRSLLSGLDWPARTGALRRVVAPEDLLAANAIGGATWSAMFAFGMALGGLVASAGIPLALAIDAGTFLVAAALLATLPAMPTRATSGVGEAARRAWGDLVEAAALARGHAALLRAVAAKTPFALAGGGGVVMLNLVADRTAFAGTAALSLGLLQASRGIGTGVGPLLAVAAIDRGVDLARVWRIVAVVSFVGIAATASVTSGWLLVPCAALWGAGVGANWMLSSAELQRHAPDEAIGRLSGLDMLAVEVSFGSAAVLGGLAVEASSWPAASAATGLALGGAAWALIQIATGSLGPTRTPAS